MRKSVVQWGVKKLIKDSLSHSNEVSNEMSYELWLVTIDGHLLRATFERDHLHTNLATTTTHTERSEGSVPLLPLGDSKWGTTPINSIPTPRTNNASSQELNSRPNFPSRINLPSKFHSNFIQSFAPLGPPQSLHQYISPWQKQAARISIVISQAKSGTVLYVFQTELMSIWLPSI